MLLVEQYEKLCLLFEIFRTASDEMLGKGLGTRLECNVKGAVVKTQTGPDRIGLDRTGPEVVISVSTC